MKRAVILLLSLAVVSLGCASYTSTSAPIPKAGSMPASQTEGSLEVGADPYTQLDRQRTVFGKDLNEAGILPIQVFVLNKGKDRLLIRPSDMALAFPDGTQISPAGASATSAKMESIAGVIGAGIAFGIIGVLVASNAEDKARAARLEDYRRKEFQEAKLGKDDSAHGFIYFIPAQGTQALSSADLLVRIVKAEEGTSFVTRVPLSGLGSPQQGRGLQPARGGGHSEYRTGEQGLPLE